MTDTLPLAKLGLTNYDHDVVVVGLGPVGTTLATILSSKGLSVLAIDSSGDVYDLPRAVGMDHEVLRIFQNLGVADDLADVVGEYRTSEYVSSTGEVLRRMVSPEPPFQLAWPPYVTFMQPGLEKALRAKALTFPLLQIRLATEITALEDRGDHVNVEIRDLRTGTLDAIACRYVVGCDGARSFVREQLGISFEDLIFDEPWLVVDMLLSDTTVNLPQVNVQYCNPARPHTYVVGPKNLRRWEFMLMPGEDPEQIKTEQSVWHFLRPWLEPHQATLWRAATYRFHALVAKSWREGNVFLAGDACHMTPPFLAQGMVQGIKDAANLGWKISAVLKGASPDLLDSYEIERRPVVRDVIATTKALGQIICERDPELATERDRALRRLWEEGKGTLVRQDLFPAISAGVIGWSGNGEPAPAAGRQSPQPWIVCKSGDRRRLDDILPEGFKILVNADFHIGIDTELGADRVAATIVKVSAAPIQGVNAWQEEHTVFKDWLNHYECGAILVRPDHVVFGGAKDEADLNGLLQQLLAHLR
ncbi:MULTISPECIES: bifunctional 3-(3-hydroxy-phenyl)propionate/3-hydroxycinnamic acid hydroxylase [unclassified Rhizobium]|uniref:bifunctional 3-(3-hydroxy-phenyl)propionate/3-hydroxycinnamic acid hydroxylase n=1 Tax=unclassified Rhizobium TaxID=2613769 RepID=UPI002B264214|nr:MULTISPECIES: bifunctional 3-(3-hydroxy-phenyl)propionate/3-hydroxycinnamic acid hydroxylase [unclassified Rhizobium]